MNLAARGAARALPEGLRHRLDHGKVPRMACEAARNWHLEDVEYVSPSEGEFAEWAQPRYF
jgi:hypothetical protein